MAEGVLAGHARDAALGKQPHTRRLLIYPPTRRPGPAHRLRPPAQISRLETRLPAPPVREDRPLSRRTARQPARLKAVELNPASRCSSSPLEPRLDHGWVPGVAIVYRTSKRAQNPLLVSG